MTAQLLHPDAVSTHGAGGLSDGPLDRLRLRCAVFIAGAVVMILQIVGTRIIGPHFGASLAVWTALITVTLVALAANRHPFAATSRTSSASTTFASAERFSGLIAGEIT